MTDETDVYICGICKKEFQDFVTFLQHKSSFGVFKCKLCNTSYHDREDIQQHINTSHSNQKVDVVFTIPSKASIVSTRTEPTDESKESLKQGASISVYTCRLCNRFTLIERTMLLHLQNVHKIHVTPGSVELAALMLCSKPLDATSIPRLTGQPVVVKTVTAPVSKPIVVKTSAGTQTKLSSLNIAAVATQIEGEQGIEWVELAEEPSNLIQESNSQSIVMESNNNNKENPLEGASFENVVLAESENQSNNDVQNVKMTSILKPNVPTLVKPGSGKEPDVIAEPVQVLDVEQVVCIDGGHDYISNVEIKKDDDQVVETSESEPKIENVSTIMELETVEEETKEEIVFTPSPKKYGGRKTAAARVAVEETTKKTGGESSGQKRPVVKAVSRPVQVKRQIISKSEDEEEEDEEEEEPEEPIVEDDPQPGADGMYHCRQCNRAFARERQFKAHMNVHIMYGEHYLESPGGGGRYEGKNVVPRKKQKYDMLND